MSKIDYIMGMATRLGAIACLIVAFYCSAWDKSTFFVAMAILLTLQSKP